MTEPTYLDIDDGKYGFCKHCQCEQPRVEIDEGFDHEFGFHSLPTEVCGKCGERV